jgi:hypothetical protein
LSPSHRCYHPGKGLSRKAFRQALNAAGIGWTIWDWKSGFNYWDTKKQRPQPGMREVLFSAKPQRAQK